MHRADKYRALSRLSSIEDVVVSTVAEITNHTDEETLQAFMESKTRKKLFNFEEGNHYIDIEKVRDDFLAECRLTLGWERTNG